MNKRYRKAHYVIPIIGLVGLLIYTLLLISGLGGGPASPTGSLDPGGYLLFYELCKKMNFSIHHWYADSPVGIEGCLLYLDYAPDQEYRIEPIKRWVKKGNTLIMVGVQGDADPVARRSIAGKEQVKITLPGSDEVVMARSIRRIEAEANDTVHVKSPEGPLWISFKHGEGTVHLIPDNFFFVNKNFVNPEIALMVNNLIYPYRNSNIYVQERNSIAGAGSNPVAILFEGNLLFFTLHLVLLGILFAVMSAKRFAKPVTMDPFKRRSLAAHIQGIGYFFQKARALGLVHTIAKRYFLFKIKKLLGIKGNPSIEELSELLRRIPQIPAGVEGQLRVSGTPNTEGLLLTDIRETYRIVRQIEQIKKNPIKSRKS